jgi:eukaryotic-like serine/threonine-protein kinase
MHREELLRDVRSGEHDEEEEERQLPAGMVLSGYVVERLIARGGCGSVYLARRKGEQAPVAIKVLRPALAPVPKMIERFEREVELLQRIRHPNIIEIKAVGSLPDATPFFVMEYLSGMTLDVLLQTRGKLSPEEALSIMEPVCAALGAAHAAGIVHRDVKASNVMAIEGPPRDVKLLDFGIAKLVDPGSSETGLTSVNRQIGTLTIMAPEQLLCAPVDARTDVYALGVLLYRLLTGRLPFESSWPGELVRKHLEEPAPRPSERVPLSRELDSVVLKCLEKRPERRYESTAALVTALRHATSVGASRSSSAELPRLGVGLFVELRLRAGDDDGEADLFAPEIERVLGATEERLRAGGFSLGASTSAEVLGLRLLPRDPAAWAGERQRSLEFALELHDALAHRKGADPRVHVNVSVHAGEIVVRERSGAEPEIVGGPLARTGDWAASEEAPALCATWEMLDGLRRFEVAPGPDPLVLVTRLDA